MAFTEQGIAMLSSVVNNPRAIEVNIAIMRTFVKIRQTILQNAELSNRLYELEEAVVDRFSAHDDKFELIFDAINQLTESKNEPRRPIGFNEPTPQYKRAKSK